MIPVGSFLVGPAIMTPATMGAISTALVAEPAMMTASIAVMPMPVDIEPGEWRGDIDAVVSIHANMRKGRPHIDSGMGRARAGQERQTDQASQADETASQCG